MCVKRVLFSHTHDQTMSTCGKLRTSRSRSFSPSVRLRVFVWSRLLAWSGFRLRSQTLICRTRRQTTIYCVYVFTNEKDSIHCNQNNNVMRGFQTSLRCYKFIRLCDYLVLSFCCRPFGTNAQLHRCTQTQWIQMQLQSVWWVTGCGGLLRKWSGIRKIATQMAQFQAICSDVRDGAVSVVVVSNLLLNRGV